MLNRVSVNVILKSVIATLAAAVVVMLALDAWSSWHRLSAAKRIVAAADASTYMFKAVPHLRVDRNGTRRDLLADTQFTSISQWLRQAREGEMPALKSALVALESVDLPDRAAVVADFADRIKRLAALQDETAAAIVRPKAERSPALAQKYFDEANALLETLDKLSTRLTRSVKLEDAFIDQLMELKQLGWTVRNTAGDGVVMVVNGVSGMPLPADAVLKYSGQMSKAETAWAMVEDVAAGLPLPPQLTEAIAKAKRDYFGSDHHDLLMKLLKSMIAGEKVEMKADDLSRLVSGRLAHVLAVAEAALDVAKEHAAAQRASAMRMLGLQVALLVLAVLFAGGMFLLVSRRVTGPLGQIQGAMMKLAGGDFGVVVPCLERKDEIGAMANAVEKLGP